MASKVYFYLILCQSRRRDSFIDRAVSHFAAGQFDGFPRARERHFGRDYFGYCRSSDLFIADVCLGKGIIDNLSHCFDITGDGISHIRLEVDADDPGFLNH